MPHPRSFRRAGAATISFIMAACLLLPACRKAAAPPPAMPPAQVEVYVTRRQTVPATFSHIGQVEASQDVEVRARVEGVVLSQGFEEGTTVTQGDFLFRIDPRPFEANLAIAEAKVVQAGVNVESEQRNLSRTQGLARTNSVSREEMESAQTKYNTALAGLKLAEADRYKSQLELSYTTVTASISGKIGRAEKRPGDLVDTGENSLLCSISQQNPAWIVFHVSEREALDYNRDVKSGKIKLPPDGKLSVGVELLDHTPYPQSGEINYFDVKIDPQTGTALVRAELPNPEGRLVPGQFVKVFVRGAQRDNMVVVPQAAIQQGMQGSFVYVAGEKGLIEMRPVTLGTWEGQGWLIESGLEENERVVIGGLLKVRPGATVDVTTVTEKLESIPMIPVNRTGRNLAGGAAKTNDAVASKTETRKTDQAAPPAAEKAR